MTITNFDPRSSEFFEAIPKDVGLKVEPGTSVGGICSLLNEFVSSFISKYENPFLDVEGVEPLSGWRYLLFRHSLTVIEEEFSLGKHILCVDIEMFLPAAGGIEFYNTAILRLDSAIIGEKPLLLRKLGGGANRFFGDTGGKSLSLKPFNKFTPIPGKVTCYTFILENNNSTNNAHLKLNSGGICVNIWVSLSNCSMSYYPWLSKFTGNGIAYDILKHNLSYCGIHVHPDGTMSAKIKESENTSYLPLEGLHAGPSSAIYPAANGAISLSRLFSSLIQSPSFQRDAFGIPLNDNTNQSSSHGSAVQKIPENFFSGAQIPDSLKKFVNWWNASIMDYDKYYRGAGGVHLNTSFIQHYIRVCPSVGENILDSLNTIEATKPAYEFLEEHPGVFEEVVINKEDFDIYSRRSAAGNHLLRILDNAK